MNDITTNANDTLFVMRMGILFYSFAVIVLVLKIVEHGGFC
jgi:hypothetical protein